MVVKAQTGLLHESFEGQILELKASNSTAEGQILGLKSEIRELKSLHTNSEEKIHELRRNVLHSAATLGDHCTVFSY